MLEELAEELIQIYKAEKELQQRKKEIQEKLKAVMKEHNLTRYVSKSGEILLVSFKKKRFDVKKLKEKRPEIYESFLVEQKIEQFRIAYFESELAKEEKRAAV